MKELERLHTTAAELARECDEFAVAELSVFGSILRDDFRPESDVDFLVEFRADAKPGLFHLIRLQHRLEDLTGRRVDLVPKDGLKRAIRDAVLASARRLYAA